jgi:phospho-N-acetylmuramoyl-pentapeptide-transferase
LIYWLYNRLFNDYFEHEGLTLRMSAAALASFAIVLMLGPWMIRFLIRKKVGARAEFDHIDLNQLTKHKSNTPTMGGILIVIAIFFSVLLFANLRNMYIIMALLAVVWLGVLGGVDDWLKLRQVSGKGSRDGLKMWEKILFQIGLAVLLSIFIYKYGGQSDVPSGGSGTRDYPAHNFYVPFLAAPLVLGPLAHALITVLTMVGASNAVNLTDGMDGLAAGIMVIVTGVLMLVAWVVGVAVWSARMNVQFVPESAEMTILCASIIGACLGFLWYNAHPAQVFMGDTGSLTLGGLIGYVAVVVRQELLLVIAGGVFVMEALSVILQVGYFKATKPKGGMQGKRIFRCAPLHHHFHLGGWAETKVVARFWIISLMLAALALAMLKWKLN